MAKNKTGENYISALEVGSIWEILQISENNIKIFKYI